MAGFPACADNHVRQQIVEGLVRRGWKVVRSVDAFGEAEDDEVLFDYAAKEGLVFVTCDKKIHAIAKTRNKAGQAFRMVFWKQAHHVRMSDGDFIKALEELSLRLPNRVHQAQALNPLTRLQHQGP